MTINYNDTKKAIGDKYFLQYPDGNNVAAMWKIAGSMKLETNEDKIKSFTFQFVYIEDPEKFHFVMMQYPLLFKNYNAEFKPGQLKKLVITPKEEVKFQELPDGLTDKTTKRIITQAEYEKIRSSIGFIA